MGVKRLCFSLLILSSIFIVYANADDEPECIYGIYVKTGSIRRAGTHSKISLTLADEFGAQVAIPNLEDWGLMGPGFNYFETGDLNIFGGKGPCLNGSVCGLRLDSDGSGPYAGWYCEYVEVSTFGLQKPCSQQHFTVEQWLAKDEEPYELTAVVDMCPSSGKKRVDHRSRVSMVTSN